MELPLQHCYVVKCDIMCAFEVRVESNSYIFQTADEIDAKAWELAIKKTKAEAWKKYSQKFEKQISETTSVNLSLFSDTYNILFQKLLIGGLRFSN